mmetsp:Transcript_32052/g.63561  ORF Transcript_32052/g.63561 Transcript_32052/m.63561 type:complete len:200 (-) Transcript_32052:812-1411(-)
MRSLGMLKTTSPALSLQKQSQPRRSMMNAADHFTAKTVKKNLLLLFIILYFGSVTFLRAFSRYLCKVVSMASTSTMLFSFTTLSHTSSLAPPPSALSLYQLPPPPWPPPSDPSCMALIAAVASLIARAAALLRSTPSFTSSPKISLILDLSMSFLAGGLAAAPPSPALAAPAAANFEASSFLCSLRFRSSSPARASISS